MSIEPDSDVSLDIDVKGTIKKFNHDVDSIRNKIHSFRKTRFIIKLFGIVGVAVSLFLHYWLSAILLWIMFVPDLNEIIRFFKNLKKQNV